MEKKIKITSGKQFQTLISELEKNPSLAKGFHRGITPNNFKTDWEEITTKLNSVGPPIRDSDGWQKVWRDFKFKVKKKLAQKEELNANGSTRIKQFTLLPLEEAAANLMQFQKELNTEIATSDIQEDVKIKTEDTCVSDHTFLDTDFQPSVENSISDQELMPPNRKKRKTRKNAERQELLEKFFSDLSYTMIDVRNVLNDWCRCQQKMCEIEEEKLIMLKRRHEREEQLYETELKLNSLKLKLKTKELELLEKQCMR